MATSADITKIYEQVLGRTPDAEGLSFWTQALAGKDIGTATQQIVQAAAGVNPAGQSQEIQQAVQNAQTFLTNQPTQNTQGAVSQDTQAAAQPLSVASGTGAYGFVNGAPVLNGNQLRSILGNEMSATQDENYGLIVGDPRSGNFKQVNSSQADTVGWNLSSKYNGTIKTGAALHGVEGSVADLKGVFAAEEAYQNALRAAGGNTEAVNREQFFRPFMDADGVSTSTAFSKLNDNITALQNAAQQLGIDPNLPPSQLLDQVNQRENRVAVTGRTNSWGTNAPGGGDSGHAAVIYTPDASGRLVASSDVQTFNASDPRRSGLSGPAQMAIGAALTTFGAPYLSQGITALFPGMNSVAADAIARGLVNGAATGVITGDAEKAILAGLASGAGSYAVNSGVLGDVMNRIGLGETASQFNIPTTTSITQGATGNGAWLGEGVPSGIPEWDQAYTNAGGLMTGAGTALGTGITPGAGGQTGITPGAAGATGITAGAGLGTAAGTGLGTALGTAAGTGLGTAAGTGLINTLTNPDNLTSLLTGGANAAINWAALNEAAQQASATGNMLQNAATTMGQQSNVPFTPYTVTTGGGTANVSPNAATTLASMPYQQIRGAAQQQALQALGAINPATASQTMFGRMEALAAPTRERDQVAMQERLARQGLLGFGSNQPTVGGTTRTINPLMESLLSAQETGRAQQALASTQFGSTEAQRMQQIAAGLQNQALGIDNLEQSMLGSAAGLSGLQNQLGQSNASRQLQSSLYGLGLRSGLEQEALANRMAGITGIARAGSGLVNNQQTQNALSGLFSGILNRYIL
jgi:hypothetical protein